MSDRRLGSREVISWIAASALASSSRRALVERGALAQPTSSANPAINTFEILVMILLLRPGCWCTLGTNREETIASDERRGLGTILAVRPSMRLVFNRGTVLMLDAEVGSVEDVPGVLWDSRVSAYRYPAHLHKRVRT